MITISWTGDSVGLNEIYSSPHWSKRKKLKDGWKNFFVLLLNQHKSKFFESYSIELRANGRRDIDNLVMLIKFLNDTMKSMGMITDDNPKYFKKLTITSDKTLDKNTYHITISHEQ